jgi:putative lipoprotein (rSAM/lipoprotein system)
MKKIELKSRKLLRKIFGCISLTAVAFVFQACYGPEPDHFYDVKLTGTVRSKTTNNPIEGIKVAVNDEDNGKSTNYGFTDENGMFSFYATVPSWGYFEYQDSANIRRYTADSIYVHFLDIDGIKNGEFEDKIVIINPAHKDEVKIFGELEEKQ